MYQPLPHMRKEAPYPDNGSATSGWGDGSALVQRPRKDIGEGGIDPEVHGMASANNMVSPIPNWRPETAYDSNGSATSGPVGPGWGNGLPGFAQRPRKDIGEGGIDAEVHGMASANNMVSPIPNWRPDTAYDSNGSATTGPVGAGWGDGLPSFAQYRRPHRKDIGEGGIDPEVHGMASANNMVSPIPNWRPDSPYDSNGSAESGPVGPGWGDGTPGLAQRNRAHKDIGRDEVRPDVYTVVWNLVDPAPMPRTKHAPLEFEHPWDEVDHILKMREIAAMNYVDREDAAIKHLREQIAKAEAAAAAKEDDDDKALAKADKKTEAKDAKKTEVKDAKKTNEPKKDEAKKTTETEKPAKKEEKAAPAKKDEKATPAKKEEKAEPAKAVAQTPAKPAAPATKTEAPKSDAALAKKDEKAAPAKEEKKATPAKEEKKAEPAKAAAQTPAKKADAPKKAEAPKPAPATAKKETKA